MRTNTTVIGALAVRRGDADALICGLEGRFQSRLRHIRDIIGLAPGAREFAALSLVITSKGAYFLADTHVRPDPTAEEIADMTIACASHVAALRHRAEDRAPLAFRFRLGRHALGAQDARGARASSGEAAPDLEVDGEMAADTALSQIDPRARAALLAARRARRTS